METVRNDNLTESGYIPYMEMKSSFGQTAEETEPRGKTTSQSKQNKDEGYGLSLQLGEEYERKKQKLREELHLDYRRYVSEKQNVKTDEPVSQPQTLSLPLRERRSTKDKLQDETVEDYSPLLRGDEEIQKIKKTSKTPQPRRKDNLISSTPYHPSFSPKPRGRRSPERTRHSTRNNPPDPAPNSVLIPVRRGFEDPSKRWRSRRERYTSEEELTSDEEEEEEELKLLQKKGSKHRPEPALAGRRYRKLQHKADKFTDETREVDVRTVNEEEHQEENRRTPLPLIKAKY